jgi:hypothetical protein
VNRIVAIDIYLETSDVWTFLIMKGPERLPGKIVKELTRVRAISLRVLCGLCGLATHNHRIALKLMVPCPAAQSVSSEGKGEDISTGVNLTT